MGWLKSESDKILELKAAIKRRDAIISVLEAERDHLAGVVARDRQRVLAESAIHSRTQAEAEGMPDERNKQSIRAIG